MVEKTLPNKNVSNNIRNQIITGKKYCGRKKSSNNVISKVL